MGIPAIFILAVFFWLITSCVKYWYFSKFHIKYTHKLDDKVLEEINRPPPQLLDKILKIQKEREKNFDCDPERFYNSQRIRNIRRGLDPDAPPTKDDLNDKTSDQKTADMNDAFKARHGRPMTIFEEIDLRKEEIKKKGKTAPKYDRSIFEDSLSRLHRELKEERKKAAEMKKSGLASAPEKDSEMKSPVK